MFEPSFQVLQIDSVNVVTLLLPEMMDSQEFDRLNQEILAAVSTAQHGHWVLDLAKLNYLGSSSLGLMVNLRQRIMELGGQLILCNVSPQLMRIMRTCCLERLFVMTKTRGEAMKRLGR